MIKVLTLLSFLFISLYAERFELSQKGQLEVLNFVSYYEDKNDIVSVGEITEQSFIKHSSTRVPSFGFTESTYWFRLDITNNSPINEWWATLNYALFDEIDFFLYEEGKLIKETHTGDTKAFNTREIENRHFIFSLPLENEKKYRLLFKIKSSGPISFPLKIENTFEMIESEQVNLILVGLYYGFFLLIILYNIVHYYNRRDKNYLVYLSFISLFVIWQLTLDGLGVQYFWKDNFWMIETGTLLAMSSSIFVTIIFGRAFLKTKKHLPNIDRLITLIGYISAAFVITSFFIPYHIMSQINMLNSLLVPIIMIIVGTIIYNRGYLPARFYILGSSLFLLGDIVFALHKHALIPDVEFFNYTQQIGSMVEMIFISWGLADNARLERHQSLKKQEVFNRNLQKEIDKSLNEARKKDQILIQQSRFAALGEMIEQIAHQWRQPLNTLALINQDIYFKMKLGTFTEEVFEVSHTRMNESLQYMSKTIDDFRDFYKAEGKIENFDIVEAIKSSFSLSEAMLHYAKIKFELEESVHYKIHGSKNQFIQVLMNLIKNSHDAIIVNKLDEGYLKVHLFESENRVVFIFEDNAGGIPSNVIDKIFDPYFTTKDSDTGTGIGLYMSKDIIEKTFSGSISVKNGTNGAVFTLVIPLVNS